MAGALAILFAQSQLPFPTVLFEFGQFRTYEGTMRTHPVPMLTGPTSYLLVAPGKHGLDDAFDSFDGRLVRLNASLIQRDDLPMLEVGPDSLVLTSPHRRTASAAAVLGDVDLIGEIVDMKCHLGVMNPGNGKVHRDCAVRCISGGIPPGFFVRDSNGQYLTLVLTSENGPSLTKYLLPLIGEPVRVRGSIVMVDGIRTLRTNVHNIVRPRE
jgi:hypothetical protein